MLKKFLDGVFVLMQKNLTKLWYTQISGVGAIPYQVICLVAEWPEVPVVVKMPVVYIRYNIGN